jgi:hypothetical protein
MLRRSSLAACGFVLLTACAPQVQTTFMNAPRLARPDQILVYDFAVAPDEVTLDPGLKATLGGEVSAKPRTEQELALGRKVAGVLAEALVAEIQAMGLPAQRAHGAPRQWGNVAVIEGQFVSINEGNEAERVAIGLGVGASSIETRTQLYSATPRGLAPLEKFTTTVKSGFMPGMAETMGAGAIGGHLAASAAVGAGLHAGSELLGGDPEAEAKRTAKAIAKQLRGYFAMQSWVALE